MTVDEIKAELDLRGVDYQNCITKSDMTQLLAQSRAVGKADPSALTALNGKDSERDEDFSDFIDVSNVNEDLLKEVTASDGTLPGGMSVEMLRTLTSSPAIMNMLRDPKLQDMMRAVMTGGPDAVKKYMTDPGMCMQLIVCLCVCASI